MRLRLGLIYVLLVSFFILIAFRLAQLQVFKNSSLEAQERKQRKTSNKQTTYRLPILDRNGEALAVNMRAASIFAHPNLIKDKYRTAMVLAKHLGHTRSYWIKRLRSKKPFIWIKRQIDEKQGKRIAKYKLPGIFAKPENTRLYPNGSLAAQLIGFTDIDGKGISGIEFAQDKKLRQSELKESLQESEEGLYLTIDRNLQYLLEEELRNSLKATGAKSVLAIVMDPYTGEILAMGQQPSFDPNHAHKYPGHLFINRLTSHLYEPGSTLKVLFSAAAIDRKLLHPNSKIDGNNGQLKVGKKIIREADRHHRFQTLTLAEVIRYSSNIGAIRVAQKLGIHRVRETLSNFGLTKRTQIGLPGEVAMPLKPIASWSPLLLANVAFGQGVSTTPLQMAAAFTPFANGGYWIRPKILRNEVGAVSRNNLDIKRVLSPQTAETMKSILISVTEDKKGVGRSARIPGVRIAGKTGTAQKYKPGRGYRSGKYFSSFIGFFPADHPQLLVSVSIDEPKDRYYASQVAAPLFRRISEHAMQILDRAPKRLAKGQPVLSKPPPPPPSKPATKVSKDKRGKWVMPNLSGMSIRETLSLLGKQFNDVKIRGSGYLTQQRPSPGSVIHNRTRIVLRFSGAS